MSPTTTAAAASRRPLGHDDRGGGGGGLPPGRSTHTQVTLRHAAALTGRQASFYRLLSVS